MDWIYRTFLNPLSVIDSRRPSLSVVALVVLGGGISLMFWVPNMALSPVSIVLFLMVHILVWVAQSIVLDFCAQLLGHTAPRLSLLIGTGMSQVYLWCLVPFKMIQQAGLLGSNYIGSIGFLSILFGVLTLTQLMVVKAYGIPFVRSFLVLALPWIVGGACLAIIVGVVSLPGILTTYLPV